MRRLPTIAEARAWRRSPGGDVGFVPTMGALHEGHLTLVRRARAENPRVAASIFVNPTQFGPGEDYTRYPRDLERDAALLEDAGCDALFVPAAEDMYPGGAATMVEPAPVAHPLEGERRPGHFRGVATVVLKLFNVVQPARAYFGEKDAQQLAIVRRMVRDLDVPVHVVGCPTVREPDGLALSSRNRYLGPEDRAAAPVLHRALQAARAAALAGERDAAALRALIVRAVEGEPRVRLDYVSVADPETFDELSTLTGPALALIAARVGPARLIDNLRLD